MNKNIFVLLICMLAPLCAVGSEAVSRTWPDKVRGCHAEQFGGTNSNVGAEIALATENQKFNVMRVFVGCNKGYDTVTTPPATGDVLDYYSDSLTALDENIFWAKIYGQKIVVVLGNCVGRNSGQFWDTSETSQALWAYAAQFWSEVAARYKNEDAILGYDLLNEPQFHDAGTPSWDKIAPSLEKGGVVLFAGAKSGSCCLMNELRTPNWEVGGAQRVLNCQPNTLYTLSGYIKPTTSCTNGSGSGTGIGLSAYCYSDGTTTDGIPHKTNMVDYTSQTWQKVSGTFTSSATCTQISAECRFTNAAGRAYFDNITLNQGDPINGNLLGNPGFETNGVWWIGPTGSARTSAVSYEGDYCAMLQLADGYAVADQNNIPLTPGKTMTLQAWVKGDALTGLGARLHIAALDANHNLIQSFITTGLTGTFDWQYQSLTFTVPAGTVYGHVMLRTDNTNGGTAYFDEAALFEGSGNLVANGGFESPNYWSDTLYGMLATAVRFNTDGSTNDDTVYLIKQNIMGKSMYTITPSTDSRTIYSSHFYQPTAYTLQGVQTPFNGAQYYSTSGTTSTGTTPWNKAYLTNALDDMVGNWLSDYQIPGTQFLMGEFGVVRPGMNGITDDLGQGQWTSDAMDLFDAIGIHWINSSYGEGWNGLNDTYNPAEATFQQYPCPPAPWTDRPFGGIIGNCLDQVLNRTGGSNMISVNGGMEFVDPSNNMPYHWCVSETGGLLAVDSTVKRSGTYSFKMSNVSSGTSEVYQDINVVEGYRYPTDVYVKTAGVTGNGARLLLEYFDQYGNEITGPWDGSSWQTGSVDWTKRGDWITTPAGCVRMRMILHFEGSGTAYFDDAEMDFLD